MNVSSTGSNPKINVTLGPGNTGRKWNINVTQLMCNSTELGKNYTKRLKFTA